MKNELKNIFVAGHNGMVGSAIVRQLNKNNNINIITKSRKDLDLTNQNAVIEFFNSEKINQVYLAAAKVGGIFANNVYPAEFIYQNLMIQCNVINAAHISDVQKLLFLGSSCIYPGTTEQPIQETALLTGALERTNEPYAISKIAGLKLCESYNRQFGRDYRSIMPTNLYGPFDNFHSENSHVIPALIRRFHEAKVNKSKEVIAWGSGKPMREFLHVDDMAAASIHVMQLDKEIYKENTEPMLSHINVGTGVDCTIRELVEAVAQTVGFKGDIIFDTTKPDGTMRKVMDVSLLEELGWKHSISLREGLLSTYQWFKSNQDGFKR